MDEFRPRVAEQSAYHGLLFAILIPVATLPIVWGVAIWAHRRARVTGSRSWARRLLGLALVDTLVGAAVLVALYAPPAAATTTRAERPVVAAAERAGAHGLFEPRHARDAATCFADAAPEFDWRTLVFFGAALLLASGLGRVVRRRGGSARSVLRLLGGGALVLAGSFVVAALVRSALCTACGGHAPGTLIVAQLAQALTLVAGGYWLSRDLREPSKMPLGRGLGLTYLYALTWAPRALALALVVARIEASLGPLHIAGLPDGGAVLLPMQMAGPLSHLLGAELGVVGGVLVLLAGGLLGPLGEELLFRGALVTWLHRFFSKPAAIGFGSALFALLHVQHGAAMVVPFVMGVVFGWSRLATGSVWPAIAVHATFNTASIALNVLL